jgi:hypothetical protein
VLSIVISERGLVKVYFSVKYIGWNFKGVTAGKYKRVVKL